MSDNKNVIELKFGVSGGGKISGESGRQILQDIQSIAKEINKSGVTKLKFSLDTDSIEKEVQSTNKKITKSITQDSGKFLRAYNQLYKYMDKYGDKLEKSGLMGGFKGLQSALDSGNITAKEFQETFNDLKLDAIKAGVETTNVFDKLGSALKTNIKQKAVTAIAGFSVQQLKEVYDNVVKLDSAVVNLSMVTGYNRDRTKELVASYSEMAQELGAVTSEVAAAADDWLRQGYSLEDTNELIKTSTVLSKIGLIDSAEATQYLTSAIKGYKVEINDAMSIADKLSAVDMAAAVSVGGLAEGMSKTANSARLAGVEMDTLLGYLAAVGEVTQQDMASIGNAFKTMFARYSNVKLNKLVDDDGESLNDYERILTRVGIRLRDNLGEFRDFTDVLDDVQAKWSSLTEVEQSAIATALGATRQKENVLTLMENYGKAMEYAGISADSAGTAMEKYDAYSQGIEANIARARASFESLSTNLLNSNAVVTFVKLTNGALQFADALAKCKLLLPAIVGVVTSIKNVGLSIIGGIYPRNALAVTLNESLLDNDKRVLRKTTDTGACKKRIAA
jgi:TP901 family phage tail tape measure protein|nr:MAG TPA: minor tail protein [Caudoviricetes sp.]